MRKPIWNDAAFKRWVREGAKARGQPLHEVLKAAGVNKYYLNETAEGRSTNVVLNLADVLEISPGPLFGWPDSLRIWETKAHKVPRDERAIMTARVIAVQMATLAYLASDHLDSDPKTLLELVLREINRSHGESPSDDAETSGAEPVS